MSDNIKERWHSTEAFVAACTASAKITKATGGMEATIDEINVFQELLKEQGFSILPVQFQQQQNPYCWLVNETVCYDISGVTFREGDCIKPLYEAPVEQQQNSAGAKYAINTIALNCGKPIISKDRKTVMWNCSDDKDALLTTEEAIKEFLSDEYSPVNKQNSAGVWVKIEHMIAPLPKDADINEFQIDMNGDFLFAIEKGRIINAVNGWGNNCKDTFKDSVVTFLYETPTQSPQITDADVKEMAEREYGSVSSFDGYRKQAFITGAKAILAVLKQSKI